MVKNSVQLTSQILYLLIQFIAIVTNIKQVIYYIYLFLFLRIWRRHHAILILHPLLELTATLWLSHQLLQVPHWMIWVQRKTKPSFWLPLQLNWAEPLYNVDNPWVCIFCIYHDWYCRADFFHPFKYFKQEMRTVNVHFLQFVACSAR